MVCWVNTHRSELAAHGHLRAVLRCANHASFRTPLDSAPWHRIRVVLAVAARPPISTGPLPEMWLRPHGKHFGRLSGVRGTDMTRRRPTRTRLLPRTLKCPHCHKPVTTKRKLIAAPGWSEWCCPSGGSLLAFDQGWPAPIDDTTSYVSPQAILMSSGGRSGAQPAAARCR